MAARRLPLLYAQRGRFVVPDGAGGWRAALEPERDPAAARRLFSDRGGLYLFDVDAQMSGTANLEFYQRLERERVFPWVDAGARTPEDVMDAFFAGAESITVQLRHMPPERLRDVGQMAEADFYVGLTMEGRGLEKGLRPREVVELAQRVDATGVVLYEGDGADLHTAENAAFEIQRAGLPAAWVARPGSPAVEGALQSERFAVVVVPEAPS